MRITVREGVNVSHKIVLWRGVAVAAAFLLIAVAIPVFAADAESPGVEAGEAPLRLEEVVVTGSRIHIPNLTSASPIYHIDSEALSFQGNVRVEDTLRILPQVFSGQNANIANGATGTATLNLRNLGTKRTLVLINGRRLPAGSPLQGGIGADINQIPGSLIKSVEVLTGGSSATYGADAVAGVINFLMVDDFEGVKLDYQFSQYQHGNSNNKWQGIVRDAGYSAADGSAWDGGISNASLVMGKKLGRRGNVTVYGTYRNIASVFQGDRDYSSCALVKSVTTCGGSATQPQGTFSDFGALGSRGLESFDYKVEGHQFVPREGTLYNYAPTNYLQRPDQRWTAGLFAHYDVHDKVEAYAEFMFMDGPVGGPDRPLRGLLRHRHAELRQSIPVPATVRGIMRYLWFDEGRYADGEHRPAQRRGRQPAKRSVSHLLSQRVRSARRSERPLALRTALSIFQGQYEKRLPERPVDHPDQARAGRGGTPGDR